MAGAEYALDDPQVLADELVEPDFEDLLAEPAAAISLHLPEIEEASVYKPKEFDEAKHPRWPKGTPKAGQFMRAGESFMWDGKRWQVVSTAGNEVLAAEASGDVKNVEMKVFKPTEKITVQATKGVAVPGIEVAPPKRIKGGSYSGDSDFPVKLAGGENVTIVDPYVHSETHDPSIPIPAGSKLSAEDWKRFGKEDQTYYTELMGRFGAWKTQDAKDTMETAYQQYKSSIRDAIYQGFKLQYGPGYWGDSGGGRGLSLAFLFTNANKGPALEAAYKKYEEAKVAMDEMNEVVHWDLYNRTRSPDITLFHGGGTPVPSYNSTYISGKKPIYAGYSQSYNFDSAAGWGDTISATPVRIPYVALSVYSQVPGMHMDAEREIAVGARMKLSERSVVFGSDMGMGGHTGASAVRKWITSQTKQQPAGGSIVEDLKAIWNGEGPIPIPEEALVLQSEGSVQGTTYKLPPDDWQQQAIKMAGSLKYKSDDGSKEHAVGILDSMGLKPGDFIEGQKGARYVIIPDSGDTHGLRYVKLKSSSGTEVSDFSTSFAFSDSQGNEFYRLAGHLDLPKEKAEKGFTPFGPQQYAKLAVGAKTQVGKLKPGELFKYDGEGYKVTGKIGSQVSVESLDTGKKYKGNTLGVVLPLVPMEGFHAPTDFVAGDRVIFSLPSGKIGLGTIDSINESQAKVSWAYGEQTLPVDTLEHAPEAPGLKPDQAQKGDKFAHLGVGPYTITTVLKNGTIKAKLPGKNVETFTPEVLAGDVIYRPSTFAIGEKVKLKSLAIGAVVNGPSKKLHPYVVEGKTSEKGQLVYLRNLETGVLTPVSGGKSYALLHDAAAIQAHTEALPTLGSDKPGNFVYDPSKYTLGEKTTVGQLSTGDLFKSLSGVIYKIVAPSAKPGKTWLVEVVKPVSGAKVVGEQFDFSAGATATPLLAKDSLPFDHANLSLGDPATISDLEVGDTFLGAPGKSDFIAPDGMKWVVSSKSLGGMKVKVVKPDGTPTNSEMDIPFGASYPVVYHGPHVIKPVAGGGAIDVSTIPMTATYDSFKWHKAGSGLKYPKLKSMAVGTVFTDKSDNAWKIKQAGAGTLVISDGTNLFQADPNWRGLVSDGSVAFIDHAGLPEQQGTSNMPNLGALEPGDKFVMPAGKKFAGQVFEVVGPGASSMTMTVKNVETATEHNFNKNATSPAAVVKKAQPSGVLQPGDPLVKAYKTYGDLPVGLTFDHAGGKYTIIAQEPGATTFTLPGGGEKTSKPSTTLADVWTFVSGPEATTQPSPLVGANLKDTFGTWGNVPVGATFKGGGSDTIYTLSKNDAGDMVLTWGTGGSNSYAPTEPIAYMHYEILSLPSAPPAGGFAVGDKLASIYPTYGDLPEGVQFHAMPSGYSPQAAETAVTWTVHHEGGQVQVIPNTGPPFKMGVNDPGDSTPAHWFAAEPDVDAAVAATGATDAPKHGDQVLAHYPTFGEIPTGTQIKAGGSKTYTIDNDGPEVLLNGQPTFQKSTVPAPGWKIVGWAGPQPQTGGTVPSSELKVGDVFTIPAGSPKSQYKLLSMGGGANGQAMLQQVTDQYGQPSVGEPIEWGNVKGVPSVGVVLVRAPQSAPSYADSKEFSDALLNLKTDQSAALGDVVVTKVASLAGKGEANYLIEKPGHQPLGTKGVTKALAFAKGTTPWGQAAVPPSSKFFDQGAAAVAKYGSFLSASEDAVAPKLPKMSHGGFSPVGTEWVSPKSLDNFQFALTKKGKVVYKGAGGKVFGLGEQNETGALKVFPLKWDDPIPEPDGLEPTYDTVITVPLADVLSGNFFEYNGAPFLVLGKGPDGVTGMHLGDNKYVAFTGSNPHVTPLKPKADIGAPGEPLAIGATVLASKLRVGDKVKVYPTDPVPHTVAYIGKPGETFKSPFNDSVYPLGATLYKPDGALFDVTPEWQGFFAGHAEPGHHTEDVKFGTVLDTLNAGDVYTFAADTPSGLTSVYEVKKVDDAGVHVGYPGTDSGVSVLTGEMSSPPIILNDPSKFDPDDVIDIDGTKYTVVGLMPGGEDVAVKTDTGSQTLFSVQQLKDLGALIAAKAGSADAKKAGQVSPKAVNVPKVGDKLSVFKTNGDIPEGTVVKSSNSGPFTIKQASTMTHFLNSMGKAAVKDPKADKPFGLWEIVSLPGEAGAQPGVVPQVGDEMPGDLSHLPIGTVVTAFKPPSSGGMYEITGYDKSAPRGVTVSFLSAAGTPSPSKLADAPPHGSGSYWIKSLPGAAKQEAAAEPGMSLAGMSLAALPVGSVYQVGEGGLLQTGKIEIVSQDPLKLKYLHNGNVIDAGASGTFGPGATLVSWGTGVPSAKTEAAKQIDSPLLPYKYHKSGGGGYNYPKLGSLAPGTIFTDKTKTEYKLVSVQGDTAYFTKLADGSSSTAPQYAAPAKSFVHALSDLDLMSEARLVFTTSGTFALA